MGHQHRLYWSRTSFQAFGTITREKRLEARKRSWSHILNSNSSDCKETRLPKRHNNSQSHGETNWVHTRWYQGREHLNTRIWKSTRKNQCRTWTKLCYLLLFVVNNYVHSAIKKRHSWIWLVYMNNFLCLGADLEAISKTCASCFTGVSKLEKSDEIVIVF